MVDPVPVGEVGQVIGLAETLSIASAAALVGLWLKLGRDRRVEQREREERLLAAREREVRLENRVDQIETACAGKSGDLTTIELTLAEIRDKLIRLEERDRIREERELRLLATAGND